MRVQLSTWICPLESTSLLAPCPFLPVVVMSFLPRMTSLIPIFHPQYETDNDLLLFDSRQGLHIIDLDLPYSPPRHLPHRTPWEVADVQWSPFAARDYWVISTSNQKALVWNLAMTAPFNAIEHVLHAHTRAITDINFSAHHPDILATCAVDSFVYCWDLRNPARPSMTFCDWFAGATQVKWNRQDPHILASSHDKFLRIWDERKGAYPLRSIEAHDTKIYGVDWNRVRPSSVVTCSLDKSIKFWDYERPEDEPERVIRTPFPVWRARHTPFGWGVLAMPQRGNTDLHLFDRRLTKDMKRDDAIPAVHEFGGHRDQVKEFLWRPRGNIVDGIDNREFQLVSWGTDRDLHLHRVDDSTLDKIGYQKGKEVFKKFNLTRKDATYKTFRAEITRRDRDGNSRAGIGSLHDQGFSSALGGALNAGMNKAPIPLSRGWGEGGYMTSRTRARDGSEALKKDNALAWMKGVRIGKKNTGHQYGRQVGASAIGPGLFTPAPGLAASWDAPDNLGDEITQAADKFSKVTFEEVDISQRKAAISMDGPWASDSKPVYTKVDVRFPNDYPASVPPTFRLEKTSSISVECIAKVTEELNTIAESYSTRGRGCLEAVLCYLLGERRLEESIAWSADDSAADQLDGDIEASQSSSDEEDVGIVPGVPNQDLELSGTDLMGANANANVPLPKACGAMFATDGTLVCFFPPKEEKSWLGLLSAKDEEGRPSKNWRVFQGFGRLRKSSPGLRSKLSATYEEHEDEADSADDSFSSSSGSTSASEFDYVGTDLFEYTGTWRHKAPKSSRFSRTRSTEYSQRSAGRGSAFSKGVSKKPKSVVSIHNLKDLLPAKKCLAEKYRIFGEGPSVCEHNANVAGSYGLSELADVWQLAKLILSNDVPLDIMEQHYRREPILVVASQANAKLKRTDSALDLGFDDANQVLPSKLSGRVKWGGHPLAGSWLIDAIFKHFEALADVQMLAMLSCIFSEPLNRGGISNAVINLSQQSVPLSMKSPAFSLDYFASSDIAWSLYQPSVSIPSTPRTPYSPSGTFGSAESSSGQWSGDAVAPYSTGTTPPLQYKTSRLGAEQLDDNTESLSTSPNLRPGRRSTSSLTSAFAASLSRPFATNVGSSPPTGFGTGKKRLNAVEGSGGVTWGTNTVFGPTGKDTPVIYAAAYSDSESDEEMPLPMRQMNVKVILKNQNLFDDEGCASVPLLDPKQSARYKAYRDDYANLLANWSLETTRLELLKFNGMRNYFSESIPGESLISLGKRRLESASSLAWNGLDIGGHCARCGDQVPQKPTQARRVQCQSCRRGQFHVACTLCKEIVRGTYAPCLTCGHVMHSSCQREWFQDDASACPTGCGCQCPVVAEETPPIMLDEGVRSVGDESRLPTVAESPDGPNEWDGWEDIGAPRRGMVLGRGLHNDARATTTTKPSARGSRRKRFDNRSGSAESSETSKRESMRILSREDPW